MSDLHVPAAWLRLTSIDAHTAGEPLRVITGGWPEPEGDSILAKRRFAREHQDHLRRALMLEPRGHADMYGALPVRPCTPDGDVGVLFLHNEGYSTMCGHGIIGLVKVGLEAELFEPSERTDTSALVRLDTPAGRVTATASIAEGRVDAVSFENVPSFVLAPDLTVEVDLPERGPTPVRFDLAYGGAFYAYVEAADVGLELEPSAFAGIVDVGMRIKHAVEEAHPPIHPAGDADLNFLYGVIFVQPGWGAVHSRNVCVFAEGEVDRSPTGTGVSGRAAVHHARGDLALDETITIESLIGTSFDVRATLPAEGPTTVGDRPAIVPVVTGRAHVTGRHEFLVDPTDPLRASVLLR